MSVVVTCNQCEQAAKGVGCSLNGVCGKDRETTILQDLLVYSLYGTAIYGKLARQLGIINRQIDRFVVDALFTTVTNVNFSPSRIVRLIHKSSELKEEIKLEVLKEYEKKQGKKFKGKLPAAADWTPAHNRQDLVRRGEKVGITANPGLDQDILSLRQTLLYGLKGMAAYASHAYILGKEDEEVYAFSYKALAALADDKTSAEELISLLMELGKVNLRCMEILDQAHNQHFGQPEPTKVSLGIKKGPAIIVSGHDLLDLKQLLEQTEGKGINIYTHGEMLPAHAYPQLKKYPHLAGHFGTAWQNQQKEFDSIPAAILMTTNCIQQPLSSYKNRIFTTGLVAWEGIDHIESKDGKKDFSPLIAKAQELKGFKQDKSGKEILVGFGHGAILEAADKIVEAVKAGAIKHFFLIGGCDGAKPGRNYYTDLAKQVPPDCLILTLACGKFRFNQLDLGSIGAFPRLLDIGQCNDAYSAIKVAAALAKAFNCTVNDLPLSLILSWYEQKAVVILLTLLSLGIKNIRLGPSLPAFVSPGVLKFLVEKFEIKPISTPEKDLEEILGPVSVS